MKLTATLLLIGSLGVYAQTTDKITKQFNNLSGGDLRVNVDFGSIEVKAHKGSDVRLEVHRTVTLRDKEEETAFLKERPVLINQDGKTLSITSKSEIKKKFSWSWSKQKLEGKYVISVPADMLTDLKTSGGSITVIGMQKDVLAKTSGGKLWLENIHAKVDAKTSGGGIKVTDCEGALHVHTSGGGIDVVGGKGNLEAHTSGGSIQVKDFNGPADVETSGGSIKLENVGGQLSGSTSGGSIQASIPGKLTGPVKLETSGGGVTLAVREDSAFELDASTSGGSVKSDLVVKTSEKKSSHKLRGTVSTGGTPVVLRSSGGSIQVKKI